MIFIEEIKVFICKNLEKFKVLIKSLCQAFDWQIIFFEGQRFLLEVEVECMRLHL
jgi:hypothetical protein